MKSAAGDLVGIDFPLFAFSHSRDVVAAVTNAGGFGVLGATTFTPEQLDVELRWIDEHTKGRPYGVDVLIPTNLAGPERAQTDDPPTRPAGLTTLIPDAHREFVAELLRAHDLEPTDNPSRAGRPERVGMLPEVAAELLDVAFAHPIKLIANALGVPSPAMIQQARTAGVPVAALVGAREHALRQVAAGVDMLIAQGGEAGGHTGEVSTMVLVPEVIDATADLRRVPVLAAGGIVTGRQMAAGMALGADGAWTGSVWLTTAEAETAPATKIKMLAATSRDTVRSRSRTGKPSRQLRSEWTDAWDAPTSPAALPMPLQTILAEPALHRIDRAAAAGHRGAIKLATYWVGQGVGMMSSVRPARAVVADFMEDFAAAAERLGGLVEP